MYRINELKRDVLITPSEVIFHGPTDQAPDPRQLLSSIIIAEERFIVEALSYDFYKVLAAEKNRVVTDLNQAVLQDLIYTETEIETVLEIGDVVNSAEFLSVDNRKLWNEYLWKLCAECVLLVAMPPNYVRFSASGMVHSQPGSNSLSAAGAVTPSLASMKWAVDQVVQTRIDPLIYGLQKYICRNIGLYSGYRNECEGCSTATGNQEVKHKRTNFVLGIYDEPKKKCCNEWDQFNGL